MVGHGQSITQIVLDSRYAAGQQRISPSSCAYQSIH